MEWFKKKKAPASACCGPQKQAPGAGAASGQAPGGAAGGQAIGSRVKVLGSGCAKCAALETAACQALAALGREPRVEHVTDFAQIAAYGVMSTPALVVDDKVISCGKVLRPEQVEDLLRKIGLAP